MLDRSALWLLVPVKSLRDGKRRLSGVLSELQRFRLNEFFLRRTLMVASSFPGLDRTLVVSDADDVLPIVESAGARAIRMPASGLNEALATSCRTLFSECATSVLVLPVDLPLIQPNDLKEIAMLGVSHDMIICPDRHVSGTNALFLSKNVMPNFHFGADSFSLHQLEARRCGVTPKLLFNEHIEKDVDVPADLSILGNGILN